MNVSPRLGAHERHLLRRRDNPLFPEALRHPDAAALEAARQRDAEERAAFVQRFQSLLEAAVQLKPNEESATLLDLKARLDQAYTLLASLGGEAEPFRDGLRRLTETLMAAIHRAAGDDPLAVQELAHEREARQQHYHLLEQPLLADLMRPDSPIEADELVATLLSVSPEELVAALWLFEQEELARLCLEARSLLARSGGASGEDNLVVMEQHLSVFS
jgi:hypothetical protein